jgi:hypothetical protein
MTPSPQAIHKTLNPQSQTLNPQSKTPSSQAIHKTLNPKPSIPNPKPSIPNPLIAGDSQNPNASNLDRYSLRYSGGMVPDVNQLLVKGRGVFVHPSSVKAPAKLRLLYEVS